MSMKNRTLYSASHQFHHNTTSDIFFDEISKANSQKKKNRLLYVLLVWMLLVNVPMAQLIFPAIEKFYLREMASACILCLMAFLAITHKLKKNSLFVMFMVIFADMFLVALASASLDLSARLKMLVSMTILMSSIIVIPSFIKSDCDIRNLFLFTLFANGFLALTGPLQQVIGVIPEFYPYPNWHLVNARGGVPRYISVLGDPNVGGMVGALLPFSLLVSYKKNNLWRLVVLGCSGFIVAFAQSLTGIALFLLSLSIITVFEKSFFKLYTILAILTIISFLFMPDIIFYQAEKLTSVFQLYNTNRTSSSLEAPGVLPHINLMFIDLDFRLFSYLDVNDTISKILFGSTYDVVALGAYNPNAIKSHNSYKEMYLAGGLTQLGLFAILFGTIAVKAYRVIIHRRLLSSVLIGPAISASLIYFALLFVMFVFPVYYYPGVGQIFWVSVSVINLVYDLYLRNYLNRPLR